MATVSFEWKEILKLILQSDSKIEEILEVLISAISRISIDRPALDKVSDKRKTALEGMMRAQAESNRQPANKPGCQREEHPRDTQRVG